jgi:hypothetical protein
MSDLALLILWPIPWPIPCGAPAMTMANVAQVLQ